MTSPSNRIARALSPAITSSPFWPSILSAPPPPSLDELPEIAVEARVNGEAVSTGFGRNALDGPQLALQWIANTFSELGRTLEAGQVVSTGLLTSIFALNPGDEIEAEYDRLGKVSAKLL